MRVIKGTEEKSNTYIIQRFNEVMIIDPSHGLDEINDYIGNKNVSGILLTHAHSDHLDLIGEFNVPIYIHELDYDLLFLDENNGYYNKKHPYNKDKLLIKTFKDDEKISFADEYVLTIHTPGHTKGSSSFYYNGCLFSGDTLFKNDVGRHDLYSGNLYSLKKSVIKLCNYPGNTIIYPGHGDKTTVREERKNNDYFKKWNSQINR